MVTLLYVKINKLITDCGYIVQVIIRQSGSSHKLHLWKKLIEKTN